VSDTNPTLAEVEDRIAILEDNLRDLTEQAAAYSGAGDEDRSSDRIAELEQQLAALKKQRDQLT
jgi:septal ring factor EnvC (AmiA/AmiB activator)